jgi:putative transposase
MRKARFTEEQITFALKQVESGKPVGEVCRQLGVSEQSFYRWKLRGCFSSQWWEPTDSIID